VDGTAHDADTDQLPQSISPVEATLMQAGCVWGCGADGTMLVATKRAPSPP
jgi:hypothetical protein